MNDDYEQLEARLRSCPLPGLSDEAKQRVLADFASGTSIEAESHLRYGTQTLPQTIWRTIMTHKFTSACVAIAACAIIAGAIFIPSWYSNGEDRDISPRQSDQLAAAPVPPAKGENVAVKSGPSIPLDTAEVMPFETQVAWHDVIVVATYLDSAPAVSKPPFNSPETRVRFRVSRILKGRLDKDIVTIQIPNQPKDPEVDLPKEPKYPGVDELAGKEWVLMLSPMFIAGEIPYAYLGSIKDESKILSILAGAPVPSANDRNVAANAAKPGPARASSPGAVAANAAKPAPASPIAQTNVRSLKERVAEAEVIVVARYLDSTLAEPKQSHDTPEYLMRFSVSRILKGKLDKDIVAIRKAGPPVGVDVNEYAGKELILMLSPEFIAGKHLYAGLGSMETESEVLSILVAELVPSANGENVAVESGPSDSRSQTAARLLKEMVVDSKVIAVATYLDSTTATKPSETLVRFRVSRVLKGKLAEDIIAIQKPKPPQLGGGIDELIGKEWILMLSPEFIAGKQPYASHVSILAEPEVLTILAAAPVPPAKVENLAGKSSPTSGRAAARRPLEVRVAEAEVIVVATYLDSAPAEPMRPSDPPEALVRFRVSRFLKGKLDEDIVTVQTPGALVGVDVNEYVGKDWILLLSPTFIAGKDPYASISTIKLEPEVLSILAGERKDQ
jgi:hypothetical protein